MNWYSISKVATYVSELDSYPEINYSYDNFEEYITALHELELKSDYISRLKDVDEIFPKRKLNIIKRLHDIGWRYFVIIRNRIVGAFDEWVGKHRVDNADLWAKKLIEGLEYSLGEDGVVEEIMRSGYSLGNPYLGISIDGDDLINEVDDDRIENYILEELSNPSGFYEKKIQNFLNINFENEFDKNDDAVEFMQDNYLEDQVVEFLMKEDDFNIFAVDYDAYYNIIDNNDVKEVIKNKFYPLYVGNFKEIIEEITDNINVAKERLYNIKVSDTLSFMTMAISLALNVIHASGNVVADYGNVEISTNYLDWLNEGGDSELWQEEAKNEFLSRVPSGNSVENESDSTKDSADNF